MDFTRVLKFFIRPHILLLLVMAAFTFWVYMEEIFPPPPKERNFYSVPRKKPPFVDKKKENAKQAKITNLIDSQLDKFEGDYSIVIKNLTSPLIYKKNEDREFTSASIYKLAVMYKTFDLLENKKLEPDEEVAGGLTTSDALNLMIPVSDNDSAIILAEFAGWGNIDKYLEENGVDGFSLNKDTPTVTASAVATLLEKIYFNRAVSTQASQQMKELLLAQQINDRIPKYLPSDVEVAHKTGELDFLRHDAGIVFGKKSDYIFVFLTETPVPGDALENIAKLSKTIFDELEKS